MPGRGTEPFAIPDPFWQRPEVIAVLRERAIGKLLLLVHQHTGATQTQVATACGTTQPKINAIMQGSQEVQSLAVFERFADALEMPDTARVHLGLAPKAAHLARPALGARPKGTRAAALARPAAAEADAVADAAEEASADRLRLATEFDPESLDWLHAESLEIARAANRPALDAFLAARRVRGAALELAERTRRPALLADLYALCGQATALMASSAFDLNRWDESDALARSAVAYASLAGHSSLHAWTLGLAALLANWRGEPDTALSHYQRGMQVAPPGTARVRLRHIACRSYALLADAASAAEALASARGDQDDAGRHPDPLSDETGGEFAFGRARAEACAAAAWLDLGQGREALVATYSALATLTSAPLPRQPVSQVSGVHIDMATACLLNGDLEGGAEAIGLVLAQSALARNASLVGRLARTRTALEASAWAANARARQLADDIGEWLAAGKEPRAP
jgi:transcriptional regulator with XRE-family HTH domain